VRDDPQRRNARLVVYTEMGKQVNRAGAKIINAIEARIGAKLGPDKLETLRDLLAADWD
jgi:DNA-binding MarR family transcriptional regulator